jgi:hypothetical protein
MLIFLLGRKVLSNLKKDKWSKFFYLSGLRVLLGSFKVTAESESWHCDDERPMGKVKNSWDRRSLNLRLIILTLLS